MKLSAFQKRSLSLLFIIGILFLRFYEEKVNMINGTMMAFSYGYGFISRGFAGTIYQLCNQVLPIDMINYPSLLRYTFVVTMMFYLCVWFFLRYVMKKTPEENQQFVWYFAVMFLVATVPMFAAECNFGRLDLYQILFSLFAVMILMEGKFEWLIVPLTAFGIMTHQGYIFMFYHIVVVMLIYYGWKRIEKRKYYAILFASSFLVVVFLFFWFEVFSHGSGQEIYNDIVSSAQRICLDGLIHEDVIKHEILGIDLATSEIEIQWQMPARLQLFVYIILMLPFIVPLVHGIKNYFLKDLKKGELLVYGTLAIGAGAILPDLLLKVDFGRWMYTIIFYYLVVIMVLMKEKDMRLQSVVTDYGTVIKKIGAWTPWVMLAYFFLLQPLGDVNICPVTKIIVYTLNRLVLHLW